MGSSTCVSSRRTGFDPVAHAAGVDLRGFATFAAGAIVVSVYQTNSPAECHYVLHYSGARAMFFEDAEPLAKVRAVDALLGSGPAAREVLPHADPGLHKRCSFGWRDLPLLPSLACALGITAAQREQGWSTRTAGEPLPRVWS